MIIANRNDLLNFWQEIHGPLEKRWQIVFLGNKHLKKILDFPDENIKVAIRRNVKLVNILKDLENQETKKEQFLDKYDKYRNSRESISGSKIESREREGKRWGRTF